MPVGFLAHSELTEESDEEKDANRNFHICSRFDFVPLPLQAN